jgi:GTP pyrophosphokinase
MDAVAERGIAAHWRYKGVQQGGQTSEEWLSRLREALEETTHQLSQRFEAKPSSGEIFVFTPNGDIRKLPEGATVLDFAFDIHTGLGSTCTGGRVNNRAVPIREVLHNGDIVEIMTQKNQQPKADWLTFCVTSKARNRIKSVLRAEEQKFARTGREELERKLKNWKIAVPIDEAVAYIGRQLKIRTGREVYSAIATQKIDFLDIKDMLQHWLSGKAEDERRAAAAEAEQIKEQMKAEREMEAPRSSDALIIDEKINNLEYKLARCCNPIKGDAIFGFVTVAAGITIHRTDCPNAQRLREAYPYRVMEAQWRQNADGAFRATIAILAHDTSGLAAQVTELITRDMKLNIRMLNFSSRGDGTVAGTVSVEVMSASQVDSLISSLQRIKGVQKAYRTNK